MWDNFEGYDSDVLQNLHLLRMSLKSNTAKSLKALILTSFKALAKLFQQAYLTLVVIGTLVSDCFQH